MKSIIKAISVFLILVSVQFLFAACGTTSKKPLTNKNKNQTQQQQGNRGTGMGTDGTNAGPNRVTP